MRLNGALTALITPFQSGEVDYDALETFIKRQIDGGIDGLVPCGTTGEARARPSASSAGPPARPRHSIERKNTTSSRPSQTWPMQICPS